MNTSEQKVSSVEINCKCEAQAKTMGGIIILPTLAKKMCALLANVN